MAMGAGSRKGTVGAGPYTGWQAGTLEAQVHQRQGIRNVAQVFIPDSQSDPPLVSWDPDTSEPRVATAGTDPELYRALDRPSRPGPSGPPPWWAPQPHPTLPVSAAAKAEAQRQARLLLASLEDAKLLDGADYSPDQLLSLKRICQVGVHTRSHMQSRAPQCLLIADMPKKINKKKRRRGENITKHGSQHSQQYSLCFTKQLYRPLLFMMPFRPRAMASVHALAQPMRVTPCFEPALLLHCRLQQLGALRPWAAWVETLQLGLCVVWLLHWRWTMRRRGRLCMRRWLHEDAPRSRMRWQGSFGVMMQRYV